MYIVSVCVCLHSVTLLLVTWSHLFPCHTQRIYLLYPPPSLPERCHSHVRLTADIIKAVWPPYMLLAQSRNADRHRETWVQECPVRLKISVSIYLFIISICSPGCKLDVVLTDEQGLISFSIFLEACESSGTWAAAGLWVWLVMRL